ncbi:hypothetical protein [Massilia sp. TWR1-2-2]|uniref:hypothetical protein n=1 Tax=Massilia sp. TWR1-2-2 TaxID=2804584 RepID=UPI003CF3E819
MEIYEPNRRPGALLSVTVALNGNRIHRLIDDTTHPMRANPTVVKRDRMVEALSGPPTVARPKKKQAS